MMSMMYHHFAARTNTRHFISKIEKQNGIKRKGEYEYCNTQFVDSILSIVKLPGCMAVQTHRYIRQHIRMLTYYMPDNMLA